MYFEKRTPIFTSLGFRADALPQLKQFVDMLWDANTELNLISRKMSFEELIDNHVIDCLLALSHFPQNIKRVADFGSGGGLPSIIYALQFPDVQFQLYEKSNLKQQYLRHCKKIAPNIEIHGLIPNDFDGVDLVTSRAFKPIDVTLDLSRKYANSGGKYFLLKGRQEKIDEEISLSKKQFKNINFQIIPLKSPVLDVERHLVII